MFRKHSEHDGRNPGSYILSIHIWLLIISSVNFGLDLVQMYKDNRSNAVFYILWIPHSFYYFDSISCIYFFLDFEQIVVKHDWYFTPNFGLIWVIFKMFDCFAFVNLCLDIVLTICVSNYTYSFLHDYDIPRMIASLRFDMLWKSTESMMTNMPQRLQRQIMGFNVQRIPGLG